MAETYKAEMYYNQVVIHCARYVCRHIRMLRVNSITVSPYSGSSQTTPESIAQQYNELNWCTQQAVACFDNDSLHQLLMCTATVCVVLRNGLTLLLCGVCYCVWCVSIPG